jgi:hypothetical protein
MNAQLQAQFQEWKKDALKRAWQAYLSADHDPAAPENQARPDFGIIYEKPQPTATARLAAKVIDRDKLAHLQYDTRRRKDHLSNSRIVGRRVA